MNADILKPIAGHDVAIKVDFWNNETVYITKSKGVIIAPNSKYGTQTK